MRSVSRGVLLTGLGAGLLGAFLAMTPSRGQCQGMLAPTSPPAPSMRSLEEIFQQIESNQVYLQRLADLTNVAPALAVTTNLAAMQPQLAYLTNGMGVLLPEVAYINYSANQLLPLTNLAAQIAMLTNVVTPLTGITNLTAMQSQLAYLTNTTAQLLPLTNLLSQSATLANTTAQLLPLTNLLPQSAVLGNMMAQLLPLTNMPPLLMQNNAMLQWITNKLSNP